MADKGNGFYIDGTWNGFIRSDYPHWATLKGWTLRNDIGYQMAGILDVASYNQGLQDGIPAPPTVAIVSPNPSVTAGDPGGFPNDNTAFTTPIVIEVNAPDGIQLAAIALRYKDETDIERVVYRRGAFRRGFSVASFLEHVGGVGTVWRFHCVPDGAWKASTTNVLNDLAFDVDVAGGNPSLSLSPIGASS